MTTSTHVTPESKQCRRCHSTLAAAAFDVAKDHTDGLQAYCRRCTVENVLAWRKRLRDDTERYQRYLEQRRAEKRRYRLRKKLRELAKFETAERP
jgi:hypothetical protein